jgi:hypothetical protein
MSCIASHSYIHRCETGSFSFWWFLFNEMQNLFSKHFLDTEYLYAIDEIILKYLLICNIFEQVDIFSQLQNASEAFRTYISDGIAQVGSWSNYNSFTESDHIAIKLGPILVAISKTLFSLTPHSGGPHNCAFLLWYKFELFPCCRWKETQLLGGLLGAFLSLHLHPCLLQ